MAINNIFKKTNNEIFYDAVEFQNLDANSRKSDDDKFYDAVEYQHIGIDSVFKAKYNYGPKEEQMFKRNIIINFLQNLIARICNPFVYSGASKSLDENRVLKTKHQLKAIGGKFIALKTPDRATLGAVYLKATDFKASIEKYFYMIKEKNTSYDSSEKVFTLKPEFCTKEQKGSIFSYTHFVPNEEAKQFIEDLKGLRFAELYSEEGLPHPKESNIGTIRSATNYLQSFLYYKDFGENLHLYSLPRDKPSLPGIINDEKSSSPTVIISGGSSTILGHYKDLAAFYLMRGINVMMVDFRGYGESTGIPTSHKTKLDLETAYQYLSKEQGVENKDLLLHGHCLGAGSSTHLAARRKGVNILVDRSFSKYKNLIKTTVSEGLIDQLTDLIDSVNEDNKETHFDKIKNRIALYMKEREIPEKIANLASRILSLVVNYNNEINLSKIEGKIALVIDRSDDEIIPESEVEKQINSCREKTVIDTDVGHGGNWIDCGEKITSILETSNKFNNFLVEANLYRKVF